MLLRMCPRLCTSRQRVVSSSSRNRDAVWQDRFLPKWQPCAAQETDVPAAQPPITPPHSPSAPSHARRSISSSIAFIGEGSFLRRELDDADGAGRSLTLGILVERCPRRFIVDEVCLPLAACVSSGRVLIEGVRGDGAEEMTGRVGGCPN
jgi:hypothetical protein